MPPAAPRTATVSPVVTPPCRTTVWYRGGDRRLQRLPAGARRPAGGGRAGPHPLAAAAGLQRVRVQRARPARAALPARQPDGGLLPGVDPHPRHGAEHHRAQLCRDARTPGSSAIATRCRTSSASRSTPARSSPSWTPRSSARRDRSATFGVPVRRPGVLPSIHGAKSRSQCPQAKSLAGIAHQALNLVSGIVALSIPHHRAKKRRPPATHETHETLCPFPSRLQPRDIADPLPWGWRRPRCAISSISDTLPAIAIARRSVIVATIRIAAVRLRSP